MPTWSHLPRPEDTPITQEIPRSLEGLPRGWGQRSSMRAEELPSALITREVRRVSGAAVCRGRGGSLAHISSPPVAGKRGCCPPQHLSGCYSQYCLPVQGGGVCFPGTPDPGGQGGAPPFSDRPAPTEAGGLGLPESRTLGAPLGLPSTWACCWQM